MINQLVYRCSLTERCPRPQRVACNAGHHAPESYPSRAAPVTQVNHQLTAFTTFESLMYVFSGVLASGLLPNRRGLVLHHLILYVHPV